MVLNNSCMSKQNDNAQNNGFWFLKIIWSRGKKRKDGLEIDIDYIKF